MNLRPDPLEMLSRARADLRMGVPVVLADGKESMLFAPIETLDPSRFQALCELDDGAVLAITARRAETLKARAYDGNLARLTLPKGADLAWARTVADPKDDLNNPMKGPFHSARGGDTRFHSFALDMCKDAQLLPAALVISLQDGNAFGTTHNFTQLDMATSKKARETGNAMRNVVSASLPLSVSQAGRLHVFRPDDGGEEHYAVEIGNPDRSKPVLCRLHSACFTGDILGSLKCDCGPQLRSALAQMGATGAGVLLYLSQEGRGIGLANKMRAYSLQDQGFDTVEANHRLGFEDDERNFRIGTNILKKLGFDKVRLLTNNPAKVAMMENQGIAVTERVALKVGENPLNADYLATKAAKSGHLL